MIDNYKSLMLGKYQEIQALAKDETLDELERQVKVLAILADMSEDEILHLPLAEYQRLVGQSAFLSGPDINKHQVAKCYNIGGFELIPVTDFRKLETGQYIDFQTYAPTFEEHFVEFLSIILVPSGCRYSEGYDILDVQKAIREELCVTDALSLAAFFLTSLEQSIRHSLNYSEKMAQGVKDKAKKAAILEKIQATRNLM